MRPSPTPTPASLPIVPLSISTKSRTLSVQRRVFRRGGTANKRGPWRTPLLRGSSWLGRQCTAEPKAGPSVPTRSQDAAAGSAPPPTTVAVHLGPAPRVCTPGCRASRGSERTAGRQDQLRPWARRLQWGHLRLLGFTEAAEEGRGTFWMRPSMSR